ncbi:MAG: hypothetical protein QM485_03495 [Flavobacteriaceae bacterium]
MGSSKEGGRNGFFTKKELSIDKAIVRFERESLIHSYGFKGGYTT